MFQLFKKNKKQEAEVYLGLILKEQEGVALVLSADKHTKEVKKQDEKQFAYTNGWDNIVDDIDELLLTLEKDIKEPIDQVIFFLYSHMVDQEKRTIKPAYLSKVKKISKDLSLKPLGYIEYHEALALYLHRTEELPLSAIIIELDKPILSVFLYKNGELIFQHTSSKTGNIIDDVQKMLHHMKTNMVLPPRILLYDVQKLNSEANSIITHRWEENTFIQIPRIEIISLEEVQNAFLFSFENQLFSNQNESAAQIMPDENTLNEEEIISTGEIPQKEIAVSKVTSVDESFGFIVGQDIAETSPLKEYDENNIQQNDIDALDIPVKKSKFTMPKVAFAIPAFPFLKNKKFKSPPIIIGGIILVILCILFINVYFFHTAIVNAYVSGVQIQKDISLAAGIDTPGDIQIHKNSNDLTADDTETTTGKKTIGEKARGEVTIYNSTSSDKTFKSGTQLKNGNLIFLLDSDTSVASASQSLTSDGNVLTVTGKKKATVTAAQIGPDSNISTSTKLSIETFGQNEFFAAANSAFAGGTKKDIQTVSKDDIEKLKTAVIDKMKQNQSDILSKANGQHIIDTLTAINLTDQTYSKELGEEATSLTLNAKGALEYYTYSDADMKKAIQKNTISEVRAGYVLQPSHITYSFTKVTQKDTDVTVDIAATGEAFMNIDEAKLEKDLKGKDTHSVDSLLKNSYKVERYDIQVQSLLPFFLGRLPFFSRNIHLKINTQ